MENMLNPMETLELENIISDFLKSLDGLIVQ